MHNQTGLDVYVEYGGQDAVDAFLAGFAPQCPELARLTIDFVYGQVIRDQTLSHRDKAAIIVSVLASLGNVPSALEFHSQAFLRQGGQPVELSALRNGEAAFADTHFSQLCRLAWLGAQGDERQADLIATIHQARQVGVSANALQMVTVILACYAGFPAGIALATQLQRA